MSPKYRWIVFGIALTFFLSSNQLAQSAPGGLQQGDPIGVFKVTKIAGADSDGVDPGSELCYRCRYGSSPIVMIFARNTDEKVLELSKTLNAAIKSNDDAELKGLLTLLGENVVDLKESAAKVAKVANLDHVPVVVAKDNMTGPANYKIGEDELTIVLAKDSEVFATLAFKKANTVDVGQVIAKIGQMLK